jgi:[ribosomal protein S5]-alanine N-acetyltransferase
MPILPNTITTPRLHLRPPCMEDAPLIYAAYTQDPAVAKYMVWRPHTDLSQTQAFIERCMEAWGKGDRFPYILTLAENNQPIGMLEARVQEHLLDIGYVLAQSEWGKAYMPEAINALVSLAFQVDRIFRVQATCDIDNYASARTLEKCGFIQEGRLEYWTVHPNISNIPRPCYLYASYRR